MGTIRNQNDTLLDCFDGEELVNQFVDAELATAEQPRLFAHLAECETCRQLLDAAMLFRRQIRAERSAIPPEVDAAFMTLLEKKRKENVVEDALHERRPVWRRNIYISRGSAALLVVLFIAIGFTLPRVSSMDHTVPVVIGHQEFVQIPEPEAGSEFIPEQVFVFYPGVTIEGERD
jgi:predicted anti-sigma-YlaC factor YlaD